MSKFVVYFSFVSILFLGCKQREQSGVKNTFFVFNNAFNKSDFDPISFQEQAFLLKKLGYDGIEHREIEGIFELKDALQKEGLKIYADYLKIDIDDEQPYLPEWKEVIPKMDGAGMILWVHIHSTRFEPSDEAADEIIVPILQELADLCKLYGLKVGIYPHVGFVAERAEDSYRLAVKTDRENVGSVFNLCHFLKTDSEENLKTVIGQTLPKLIAVSICGADAGDTQEMGWDRLIQPLGQGTFDTYRLLELFLDAGYTGPIGLQCYNLKGNPELFLQESIDAWNSFKNKYDQKPNTLTEQEKTEGWQLLFDGVSTDNWRGINKNLFPESGWAVQNGELITNANDGAESANGGDIITKEQYGKFILKWEWKMDTKGGNSGVKYFTQEGIGENSGYGFGLEYQILDDKNHSWMLEGKMQPDDYHTIGALYEIYPASPTKLPSPLGLWNESMIVCNGQHIEHWLNGKLILEFNRSSDEFKEKIRLSKFKDVEGFGLWEKGHILLQDHGSKVHFRNIKIKEL